MIAFDTETRLIGPGQVSPEVMCASFAEPGETALASNGDPHLLALLESTLEDPCIATARGSYDLCCLVRTFPSLWPRVLKALDEGRIHDVMLREKLYYLGTTGDLKVFHGKPISYSLASIARRRVGLDLSAGKEGDDIWRLRYAELDGVPSDLYPKEARDYALLDAQATLEVFQHQEAKTPQLFKAEATHVRASFCYYLMTTAGLEVDVAFKEELQRQIDTELHPDNLPLLYESGLITPAQPPRPHARNKSHAPGCPRKNCGCPPQMCQPQPEKLNKKSFLIPLVETVSQEHGIPLTLTEKGATSTNAEVLEVLAPLHKVLGQFYVRETKNKLRTSFFPAMEWPYGSGQTADRVHPGYSDLVSTGRGAAKGNTKKNKDKALFASVQIQQADPRIRQCYVPGDGWVFAVADFTAIDLCSLAQTIKDLFGHSTLLDQINAGIDPHSFLGSVLAFEGDPKFREEALPLVDNDDAVYQLFLSKAKTDPDWFKHWRTFAKPVGLGFPGGLGLGTMVSLCRSYGITITRADAKRLKKIWFSVYPEMREYLGSWVPLQDGVYVSPRGMIRRNCSFTQLANGRALQTPAAEGMKEAMWQVTKACYTQGHLLYGSVPVINMHDELVVRVKDDRQAGAKAEEISRLMCLGMSKILPDVLVRAEPLLTRRWLKEAKAVRDQAGCLVPWEPQQKKCAA